MRAPSVGELLATHTHTLQAAGITTARLDCLVLMEDTFELDRAHLLAHPEEIMPDRPAQKLQKLVARRATHEPLAYIRGTAQFYGRAFAVTHDTLVPRPETETMIDLLKQQTLPPQPQIADIGTGSGCIGITVALEIPGAVVDLYDISPKALAVAKQNAQTLGAAVTTHRDDLLAGLAAATDVIAANLPYVPLGFPVNEAAHFEPELALFAGHDGLKDYERFWRQLGNLTYKPALVLTEAFPSQHHSLATLARNAGYVLEQHQDFIQVFRPY